MVLRNVLSYKNGLMVKAGIPGRFQPKSGLYTESKRKTHATSGVFQPFFAMIVINASSYCEIELLAFRSVLLIARN